jgi:transcriptional regulator with XRE-family HTH domain
MRMRLRTLHDTTIDGLGASTGIHDRMAIACRGLNYREVASMTRFNHETVRRYLRGTAPSVQFIAHLARALALSTDWLLLGRGPMYRVEATDFALKEAGPERICVALGKHIERTCSPAVHGQGPPAASARV